MFGTCVSVHTWGGRGGSPARSDGGRGYPSQVRQGGGGVTPARSRRGGIPWPAPARGVPHFGYSPWSDLAGGYPTSGTPPYQTWPGVPLLRGSMMILSIHTPTRTADTAVGMPLAFTQEDFLVSCC